MKGVSITPIRRFFRRLRTKNYNGIKVNKKNKKLIKILAVILALILIFVYITVKLQPLILGFAESSVKNAVTIAINEAVAEKMKSGDMSYESLVTINKDDSGNVTAIVANMININRIQAELTENITRNVKDAKTSDIAIPFGNMIGNPFLSGRGPLIKFRIISVNSTKASFLSSFTSAGINQTRHRILLEASVMVNVLVPGAITSVTVTTQIMIAETVIVGKVPNNYASFGNGTSSGGNSDFNSDLQKYQFTR